MYLQRWRGFHGICARKVAWIGVLRLQQRCQRESKASPGMPQTGAEFVLVTITNLRGVAGLLYPVSRTRAQRRRQPHRIS